MMKDLMMGASKATYEVAWVEKMKQIKAVN